MLFPLIWNALACLIYWQPEAWSFNHPENSLQFTYSPIQWALLYASGFTRAVLNFFFLNWVLIIDFPSSSLTVQFRSVTQSCPTLCDPMHCSTPGFPVHHQLPELAQTHVHRVSDAIQPSRPLLPPSPLALNLSQHQGLFQWVSSSHQVDKVLEFQLQHRSFQWIFKTDL